jgi:hypothetical protein
LRHQDGRLELAEAPLALMAIAMLALVTWSGASISANPSLVAKAYQGPFSLQPAHRGCFFPLKQCGALRSDAVALAPASSESE